MDDDQEMGNNTRRFTRAAEPRQGSNIRKVPVNSISRMAENVSIAYQRDVWTNDMIFKDQDDCAKRLLCELNARQEAGETLTQNERIIAQSYGKNGEVDINEESLEFDIAVLLGKIVSCAVISHKNHPWLFGQELCMIKSDDHNFEKVQIMSDLFGNTLFHFILEQV